jgi:hypothetical protein
MRRPAEIRAPLILIAQIWPVAQSAFCAEQRRVGAGERGRPARCVTRLAGHLRSAIFLRPSFTRALVNTALILSKRRSPAVHRQNR